MSCPTIVAVDIGVTGALCALGPEGACIHDLPTAEVSATRFVKRRIDAHALMALFRQVAPAAEGALFAIEDIHTMPGRSNSPQSQGSLMESLAIVRTCIELGRWGYYVIPPKAWQKAFGLDAKKGDHLEAARRVRPDLAEGLTRQKDHNRADAVLIAHYAQMIEEGRVPTSARAGVTLHMARPAPRPTQRAAWALPSADQPGMLL